MSKGLARDLFLHTGVFASTKLIVPLLGCDSLGRADEGGEYILRLRGLETSGRVACSVAPKLCL